MIKQFFNEKGLTLAELLAALAIGSIILIMLISILLSIPNQYEEQSTKVDRLTNLTLASKAITRDLRRAPSIESVQADGSSLKILTENYDVEYYLENNIIRKNDVDYVYEIKSFQAVKVDSTIQLKIESLNGKQIETSISLREGQENEYVQD